MKSQIPFLLRKYTLIFLLTLANTLIITSAAAQAPDCTSGTTMYALFQDSTASNANTSPIEIRPVNYATGAVGGLMGGTTYSIFRNISGTNFYGSSALAVHPTNGLFYVMTQMGTNAPGSPIGRKHIFSINTSTATTTIIGTTPNGALSNYHFVKMAISPTGVGYAIGVAYDTTAVTAAQCNPLVRFTACATTNCSTIEILGYLPSTGVFRNWNLFNGDMAFDAASNLYFMPSAYQYIGTSPTGVRKYTDVRLIRINAGDIPAVAGSGTIPATFLADFNVLDSTIVVGNAFDPLGNLYTATRRYQGVQAPTQPPFVNELYVSGTSGTATLIPGFIKPTPGYAVSDLASCFFPLSVLSSSKIYLTGRYNRGNAELNWQINNNTTLSHFEIQSSDDGENFTTICTINAKNTQQANQSYSYSVPQTQFGKAKIYRIRENMINSGMRLYSNAVSINPNATIRIASKPKPNPFINAVDIEVELKTAQNISCAVKDRSGRNVYYKQFAGTVGLNKLTIDGLGQFPSGLYILEVTVNEEVIREKIIKN